MEHKCTAHRAKTQTQDKKEKTATSQETLIMSHPQNMHSTPNTHYHPNIPCQHNILI